MMKVSAPGDEYFGRLKLSYLGINNTFRDESIRAGAYTTDSHIISQVDFAEDALRVWANHYPKDPQLARSYFMAYTMYRKIWTEPGQTKAWQYLHIIEQRFPSSYFGKLVKKDLIGFTEHYFMEPQPCPSVEPSQSPLPGGRRPPPTPSPTPSPVPTVTPSPVPGQPAVEVLPVPCYTPIPPTPSPTPVPTIGPSALPTALPSGVPASHGSPAPVPLPSGLLTPTPLPSVRPSLTPSPLPTRTPLVKRSR